MPAVIFDLDGVLVNSEPYWRDGFRAAIAFLATSHAPAGIAQAPVLSDEDLRRFEGGRVPDTIRTLAAHYFPEAAFTDATMTRAAQHAVDTATARLTASSAEDRSTETISQNISVAHELASSGYRLAVASSSHIDFIQATLGILGLQESIRVVESAYDIEHAKPHPEVYLNALAGLGVSAREAVAIEDSTTGLHAALNASIPTVWVNAHIQNGQQAASKLRAEGHQVEFLHSLSVAEINSFFKESNL